MNTEAQTSRCGFVVIKFRIRGESHYLMRKNLKWRDISFVGGHINERDNESLMRAARRELLEEVPSLRTQKSIKLVPLVDQVAYGPIYSPSAKQNRDYCFAFFLVEFGTNPLNALEQVGHRSLNVLVAERELLDPKKYVVAGLVQLLHETQKGGLQSIPYSWDEDLGEQILGVGNAVLGQQELSLG
jgi:ADP-ribose pyrophosphatase YjhB (NUDIX family)